MNDDRSVSSLEIRPLHVARERYDVVIMGGGLAGLTLAIQMKQRRPDTSIAVLEKREGPAPLAAFKVGESTVPSGAHYFEKVVGMEDHLKKDQLIKIGLRFFLTAGDNQDITKRIEQGAAGYPPHDNWQIDRGVFENELASRARGLGVDVLGGCRVTGVDIGDDLHTVSFTQMEADVSTKGRWVVDASGRASLLKRKFGLSKDVAHTINAAWIRLGGGLDIEDWGRDNEAWMGKMSEPGLRALSTNHLMGEGYWIWMIPLSSGPISIGICADPRVVPWEEISELDRLVAWLKRHEPQLGDAVEPRVGQIVDFLRVQDFAYGVEQVYSPDRWTLVGEAAAFADPFYSPGSDFIGVGNTFTTDLICSDLDGEDISERIDYYSDWYFRTFEKVISRYTDQYLLFGNAWVSQHKLIWDTYLNHTGNVTLFVKNRYGHYEFMKSVHEDVERLYRLDMNMQELWKQWHELQPPDPDEQVPEEAPLAKLIRPMMFGAFADLVQSVDDDELREEISQQVPRSEALAVVIFGQAVEALPADQRPDFERPINAYAVSLRPERWDADGLYDDSGVTLKDATELVESFADAIAAAASSPSEEPFFLA
jgi:flavin-dependent dehydrogenase